jgi:hypothetical protein
LNAGWNSDGDGRFDYDGECLLDGFPAGAPETAREGACAPQSWNIGTIFFLARDFR